MDSDRAPTLLKGWLRATNCARRSIIRERRHLDRPDWRPRGGPAETIGGLRYGLQTVEPAVQTRGLVPSAPSTGRGLEISTSRLGLHDSPFPSPRGAHTGRQQTQAM